MNAQTPGSDPIYKRLYAFGEMVADLLRSLFPALAFDADSLQRLPTEYVADDYRLRRGDSVWRLRAGPNGDWLHVLVLLEFQSTDNARMALRILEYTALLYGELVREGRLGADGKLPPVLPIVLYNGDAPWRSARQMRDLVAATGPALAEFQPSQLHVVLDERRTEADDPQLRDLTRAVAMLEQSRTAEFLEERLGGRRNELKQAFADWLGTLLARLDSDAGTVPASGELSLEEVKVTLEERVAEWPKEYIRQGIQEGISQGRKEGISQGRKEGISQGIEEGRNEGIAQQRALLRRLAAARFGAATGERLAGVLAAEADPERLAAVGEAIVRCETGDELLREAGASRP